MSTIFPKYGTQPKAIRNTICHTVTMFKDPQGQWINITRGTKSRPVTNCQANCHRSNNNQVRFTYHLTIRRLDLDLDAQHNAQPSQYNNHRLPQWEDLTSTTSTRHTREQVALR